MEDLTRHAVITGASSGIGTAAATALAWQGWRVTLVGRDPGRLDAALAAVRGQATLGRQRSHDHLKSRLRPRPHNTHLA